MFNNARTFEDQKGEISIDQSVIALGFSQIKAILTNKDPRLINIKSFKEEYNYNNHWWYLILRLINTPEESSVETRERFAEFFDVDPYKLILAIKSQLEKNEGFSEMLEAALGITCHRGRIKSRELLHLGWQTAAQFEWVKSPGAGIEQVKEVLVNNSALVKLLGMDKLKSVRNRKNFDDPKNADRDQSRLRSLEDIIRKVNPREGKRGPISKRKLASSKIIPSPIVYNRVTNKINGMALRHMISTLIRILLLQDARREEVVNHSIVHAYKTLIPIFSTIIDCWVEEALEEFGRF